MDDGDSGDNVEDYRPGNDDDDNDLLELTHFFAMNAGTVMSYDEQMLAFCCFHY